jgi:hypothetical protein
MAVGSIYLADGSTVTEYWDGSTWSVIPVAPIGVESLQLEAVSCTSASSCVAVGTAYISDAVGNQTLVESWDGTSWSVVPSPNPNSGPDNELVSVSCISASRCTAVGRSATQPVPIDQPYESLVETWDGTSWSIVSSPDPYSGDNYLFGVSCTSQTFCMAAGYGDTSTNPSNFLPTLTFRTS